MLAPGGWLLASDEFWPQLPLRRRLSVRVGQLLDKAMSGGENRSYPAEIAARLPLIHLPGPARVCDVFESAGLTKVSAVPLTEVDRVERSMMPLRLRLQFDYCRYLISGRTTNSR